MRNAHFFPALIMAFASSPIAGAVDTFDSSNCDLNLNAQNVNLTWGLNFDFQAINFSIVKTSNPKCDYAITFTRGSASDYNNRRMTSGSASLRYQLYKDSALSRILKDVPDLQSSNDFIPGSFPKGNNLTQAQTYYVQIPYSDATSPSLKPSGSYQDIYQIKVYERKGNGSIGNLITSKSVSITTVIPKIIEISLTAPGGVFNPGSTSRTLNFGSLAQGVSQDFDVLVRSNSGFQITLSSMNQGQMRHGTSSISTRVPYTLDTGSGTFTLNSPRIVASGAGQTSLDGTRFPVKVTSGSTETSMAGNYSDVITVTATTTD